MSPLYTSEAFFCREKQGVFGEGYEPKSRPTVFDFRIAMDRARSVPVNPWYSDRAKTECLLQASRPSTLPFDGDEVRPPLQSLFRADVPPRPAAKMPTGKGRGVQSAGALPADARLEGEGHSTLRTEGRLPDSDANGVGSLKGEEKVDGLQRALEVEMVHYLRGENSKLPMR